MMIQGSKFIQLLVYLIIGLQCVEFSLMSSAIRCLDSEHEALLKFGEGFSSGTTTSLHGRPKKIVANGVELDVTT